MLLMVVWSNHVLIHGPPQILPFAVDRLEDFVQEPPIPETTLASFQTPYILETELRAPAANCLVGHGDSSLGQQILDFPKAETESVVKPDCMADDFGGIAVSVVEGSGGFHAASLAVVVPS